MKFVTPRVAVMRAVTLRPDFCEGVGDITAPSQEVEVPMPDGEGVSFTSVYQPRGWDRSVTPKKHYAEACWRYFDAVDSSELTWEQITERFRAKYPDLDPELVERFVAKPWTP